MHHPQIASVLVGIAVALAILCAFGVALVTKPLERLHFSSPVTSFSASLIAIAVWIDDPTWQSRLKVALVAVVLFVMNAILSHATARAIRIRDDKHFEPQPADRIPLITKENPAGLRQ
jgi:multisubunit Na+/H+ antiporter MnhG subunit